MNIDPSMSRMQQEKTESKSAQGQVGDQEVWPVGHTLSPKNLEFFSQNSLVNHSIHFYL
jgi:hypothetical protein